MSGRHDPEPRRCCVCHARLGRDWGDHEDACIRRAQAEAIAARRAAGDATLRQAARQMVRYWAEKPDAA